MILDPRTVQPSAFYQFLITAVVPRPIAFVSTRSLSGTTNLAPFSFFNAISSEPPLVGIAFSERRDDPKDTLRNIRETGEFVVNVVSEALLEPMVRTSGDWPRAESEFGIAGLTSAPSERVDAPSVAESPVQLECRLEREIPLGNSVFVVGEVVLARARDDLIDNGRLDAARLVPVGRLGGEFYALVRDVVRQPRPKVSRTPAVDAG